MADKVDTECFKNLDRLRELRVSHRDLDYLIDRLQHDPMVDQLRIRRLKKRKLPHQGYDRQPRIGAYPPISMPDVGGKRAGGVLALRSNCL